MKLIDGFGRLHNYLRLSLTATCNFKCSYCYSGETPPPAVPADFLIRLTKIFADQGVNKIRLTGGEPLIHKDIVAITERIKQIEGIKHLGITTNGLLLSRYLDGLVRAGLDSLNISLDSLIPAKFAFIAKVNGFAKVWSGIEESYSKVNSVKINCVVMKGVNEDEILDFVAIAKDRALRVRFIEFVPYTGNQWNDTRFLPLSQILLKIKEKHQISPIDLDDPIAKNYEVEGHRGSIGVISSLSEPFCDRCNRLRITADGKFKVCLNSAREVSLDNTMTDEELLSTVKTELLNKPKEHGGVKSMIGNGNRPMTSIGG